MNNRPEDWPTTDDVGRKPYGGLKDGMIQKTDFTNEQVAEKLGATQHKVEMDLWMSDREWQTLVVWKLAGKKYCQSENIEKYPNLPDFRGDMNAVWKYVWPALEQLKIKQGRNWANYELKKILFTAFKSPNPALYLCEKFMELKANGK